MSLRLGWALGAGRAGAGRAGTAQAAWVRGSGAHGRWGGWRWGGRRWGAGALGRAEQHGMARGAQAGTAGVRGRWAWRAGRRVWAREQAQAGGSSARAQRARGRARQAGRRRAGRERQSRRGRAGRAAWAFPGRLGWPWAMHSVHSAHFRSVLTRFFPESPNEHCSL